MKQKGVVALEFLLLFPIIIALVYGAAVYGVVFSWQVQMQLAVDRSTAAVMHLDRSSASDLEVDAVALASSALSKFRPSFVSEDGASCTAEGSTFVRCELTKTIDSSLKIGYVPLPDTLTATASVAY